MIINISEVKFKVLMCTCVGFLMIDIVVYGIKKIPRPGEITYVNKDFTVTTGGHAINVPITLIKLGLRPSNVRVIGAVGKDLFGQYIKNIIKQYGLRSDLYEPPHAGTGKNIIIVKEGEDRRFIVTTGANMKLPSNFVRDALKKESSTITYIAMGFLGETDSKIVEIESEIKEKTILFLDFVVPPDGGEDKRREILNALKYADILHCNNHELRYLTKEDNLRCAARKALSMGVKVLFITLGNGGALLYAQKHEVRQKAFKVSVADPTGAGDAFSAGIIYGLLRKGVKPPFSLLELDISDLVDILTFAQAVGAAAVTGAGATTAVSLKKVEKLLEEQRELVLKETRIRELA